MNEDKRRNLKEFWKQAEEWTLNEAYKIARSYGMEEAEIIKNEYLKRTLEQI